MSQSHFDASLWKELQARQERSRSNPSPLIKDRKDRSHRPTGKTDSSPGSVTARAPESEPNTTEGPVLPAIWGRIFDQDFRSARDQVLGHDANDPIPSLATLAGEPPESPLFRYTVSLHSRPVLESHDFDFLLKSLLQQFQADAVAVEPVDSMGNSFRPAVHSGLDDTTVANLHFAVRDRYIEPGNWVQFNLKEFADRDPYLKKRFSSDDLEKHSHIAIFHDGHNPYPVIVVFLFKSQDRREFSDEDASRLQTFLQLIRPLVFDMVHTYSFAEDRRILQKAFRTTRKFLRRSHPDERWIVQIDGVREHPGRQAFFDRMQELIAGEPGILGIRTGVAQIFLFLCKTAPNIELRLHNLAAEFGFRLHLRRYPLEYRADKQNNALLLLLDPEAAN